MKKNYVLLASALFLSFAGFSQERNSAFDRIDAVPSVSDFSIKSSVVVPKAYGDTMAYFDFDGSMPSGWTTFNNSSNNFNWIWSDRAPGGQFTARGTNPKRIIQPPSTGVNGFMLLESDSLNTPIPPSGPVAMDAFFESNAIAIDSVPSVLVRFYQSFRFCCNNSNILEMSVRAAGDTVWTDFNVKGIVGVNLSTPDPMFMEVNISEVAAFTDSIYIRFHQGGSTYYYWMVDDIAIVEGPANDMIQESFMTLHGDTNSIWQYYTQIPADLVDSIYLQSNIINNGYDTARNVMVQYDVTQDTNCFGNAGAGSIFSESMSRGDIVPFSETDSIVSRDSSVFIKPFMATDKGKYTITASVSADSADQNPTTNSVTSIFEITDTVYAKDDGVAEATVGPNGWVGFDKDGARLLLYYELPTAATVTSLTFYIPRSTRSENTSFFPVIYGYDRNDTSCSYNDACFTTNPVASNPTLVYVDATMLGTWVTVPFLSPVNLQAGGYAIGYEAYGFTTAGQGLLVGRDVTADIQAPYNTRYLYAPHAFIYAPLEGYGPVTITPMMRMNFGQMSVGCTVGMDEPQTNTKFDISPNPSNGIFSLGISSEVSMKYNLKVTNMLGQNVYNEEVSVQDNFLNKNIDLSNLDKGVYFVTLENGFERHTKKIIIN